MLGGDSMFDPQSIYGMTPQAPSYQAAATPTQGMAIDSGVRMGWRGLLDWNNPLFWVGVVLVVTFGAAGAAGSVRLGRARLAVDVDQSS